MEDFEMKTPTDGFIHIYSEKDIITKVKPPHQMTVDLVYSASDNIFLDADGLVYHIKNDESKTPRVRKQRKVI